MTIVRYELSIAIVTEESAADEKCAIWELWTDDSSCLIGADVSTDDADGEHAEREGRRQALSHARARKLPEDEFEVHVVRAHYNVVRDAEQEASAIADCRGLMALLDAFFVRARNHAEAEIQCRAGCSECCTYQFPCEITRVEAAVIREHLSQMSDGARHALACTVRERPWSSSGQPCPALGESGQCQIYEARPLECRGWGLIRFHRKKPWPDSFEGLSRTCRLNYPDRVNLRVLDDREALDVDVFDCDAWDARLLRVENAFARCIGAPQTRSKRLSSFSTTLREALGISLDHVRGSAGQT